MEIVNIMKDTVDTQRVTNPSRQRRAASRKRTLRSRSVRAARSVWSEHQSCVIDSRNLVARSSLSDRVREGSILRGVMAMSREIEPGTESGAEVYRGIQGTCEGLPLPDSRSRNRMRPAKQRPGRQQMLSLAVADTKRRKRSGYCPPSLRQGVQDGEIAGRLSRLIVVFEIRETLTGGSL